MSKIDLLPSRSPATDPQAVTAELKAKAKKRRNPFMLLI